MRSPWHRLPAPMSSGHDPSSTEGQDIIARPLDDEGQLPADRTLAWMQVVVQSPPEQQSTWPTSWRGDPNDLHAWAQAYEAAPWADERDDAPMDIWPLPYAWWKWLVAQDRPDWVQASLAMGWGPAHDDDVLGTALTEGSVRLVEWWLGQPELRKIHEDLCRCYPGQMWYAATAMPLANRELWWPSGPVDTVQLQGYLCSVYGHQCKNPQQWHDELAWWTTHHPEALLEALACNSAQWKKQMLPGDFVWRETRLLDTGLPTPAPAASRQPRVRL